jgi:hypothetical protein
MIPKAKVLIVAPYWRKPQHVGVYRVDRFARWLSNAGVDVVLIRAGSRDGVEKTLWGQEIEIRDPIGKSWEAEPDSFSSIRKSILRGGLNIVANWLFNPDSTIFWARRVARHPLVREHGRGASLVLSSSPPESVHVAAALLAAQLKVGLIVDMRDGWLDEPLKAYLLKNSLLRWREGRLERRILDQAKQVFVTSDVWKKMLVGRLPFTDRKTTVLTNCYPQWTSEELSISHPSARPEKCTLLHAGSFTSSKFNNRPCLLLARLWEGLPNGRLNIQIVLQGRLSGEDLLEIELWRKRFTEKGIEIICRSPIDREHLMTQLKLADGLLLLSATHASILAKFFEYIPSRKPILALTLKDSSIWNLAEEIPQMFLVDIEQPESAEKTVQNFFKACMTKDFKYNAPHRFSEDYNKHLFLEKILPYLGLS